MGHVVNPISFRLGFNRYWNSVWGISDLKNYSHLTNQDFFIKKSILAFFDQWAVHSANFVVSDVKISRKFKNLAVFISIYDSSWEEFLNDFYYTFLDSYKVVKKIRRRGKVRLWENRVAYKKHKKLMRHKSVTKRLYNYYVKQLFVFYVYYIRLRCQKPLYNYIKNVLKTYIYKFLVSQPHIDIYFVGMTNRTITAAFLAKFLSIKLQRSFFLFELLRTLRWSLRKLIREKVLYGFRIKFSGRHSRAQIAVALLNGRGSISRSSTESRLDYSFSTARLRFSTCGIKVWLAFASKTGYLKQIRQIKLEKSKNSIRTLSGRVVSRPTYSCIGYLIF